LVRAAELDRFDALANSPIAEGRPTPETSKVLKDELLFQRAVQTYLWALPLINTLGMKVGSEKAFGAGYNILPVWKKRLDAKTLVATPNSDVIYAMSGLAWETRSPTIDGRTSQRRTTDCCNLRTATRWRSRGHPEPQLTAALERDMARRR